MIANRTEVMDATTIERKVRRISWELYERHIDESEIFLIGIEGSGYILAERIVGNLKKIGAPKVRLARLTVDKRNPLAEISVDLKPEEYRDRCIVVVDDVLNSGSTLLYAVNHLLKTPVRKCTTAVLVDRSHKRYPIRADVQGLALSTSLQEHIEVDLDSKPNGVYLQ